MDRRLIPLCYCLIHTDWGACCSGPLLLDSDTWELCIASVVSGSDVCQCVSVCLCGPFWMVVSAFELPIIVCLWV